MITGAVEGNRAVIPVTFRLPDGFGVSLDFVVDTGFGGYLTLPTAAVTALNLTQIGRTEVNLANDSNVTVPVYRAVIDWDGHLRVVRIFGTGSRPLLGTALLAGNEFVAQFVPNGLVTLEAV